MENVKDQAKYEYVHCNTRIHGDMAIQKTNTTIINKHTPMHQKEMYKVHSEYICRIAKTWIHAILEMK